MAKLSRKHSSVKQLPFGNFSGGINTSVAPEYIADNEMQDCQNFEYSTEGTKLKTRGGLSPAIITFDYPILGVYFDYEMGSFLVFLTNYDVYQTNLYAKTLLGKLSGTEKPMCCKFGGKVMIASGGKLQTYNYTSLTTVDSSPLCNIVFERFGRVCLTKAGSDYIYYSGIGDETYWATDDNDDSASKSVEIGYKDGSDIVGCITLATDIIVFKSNGKVFQLAGEYPNWSVYEVGRNSDFCYRFGVENLGNQVLFMSSRGLLNLQTVQTYGNIALEESGRKFNSLFSNVYNPILWNLRRKKQLIIKYTNSSKVFALQYNTNAGTLLNFPQEIIDMVETPDDVVIAAGTSLYYWSDSYNMDYNSTPIPCTLTTKKTIALNPFLLKKLDISVSSNSSGTISFSAGALSKVIQWGRQRQQFHLNNRVKEIEVTLSSSSQFALNHLALEIVDI